MKQIKLSPAMKDVLLAMQRGVRVHYVGGYDAYFFRADKMSSCTKQILALEFRGLVKRQDAHTMLTETGKQWKE